MQGELLENIENAKQSKSLPRRFQTPQIRVCLSDVTNCLETKKPVVLYDHSYYSSTSTSSKILPSRISSTEDFAVNKEVTENSENSLVWFADLCSQVKSINNSASLNSLNVSISPEVTQSLSPCRVINLVIIHL